MRAWLDGEEIEGKLAIDPSDRGLTLGDGIFETVLVRNGKPVWLDSHLARMEAAAKELGIALADPSPLVGEVARSAGGGSAALRITLTRGPGHRGLGAETGPPTLLVTLQPFDPSLQFQPATLITATPRRNEHSLSSRLKTLSYIDNILAAREAAAGGADDALMLNTQGRAACAAIGNIFAVTKSGIVTPPVADGALPGIARRHLLALGLAREAPLAPEDLANAEALFMTNSLRLVRPVQSLDGRRYGSAGHRSVLDAIEALEAASKP